MADSENIARRISRFLLRHPASSISAVALVCVVVLWFRAGRHYDSVEFLTPKAIVTVHSEMRVLMVTAVAHDDSAWEIFHNSDIATVDAPWAPAMWPRVWGTDGEIGLFIAEAHLAILVLVVMLGTFWVEKRLTRRRLAKRAGD